MAASALACNDEWCKGPAFLQMDEEEWPQNQFEMPKDAVTEQKKYQSLFADAVSTKESTIGVPVENKLMKASKDNS